MSRCSEEEHIRSIRNRLRTEDPEQRSRLHRAIKLAADEIYSHRAHCLFELIQNAEDNTYHPSSSAPPSLTFRLVTDPRCPALYVMNNEVGFSGADVEALCDVGASTKSERREEMIGEKGIGFKSVFRLSDTPEVYSGGYRFAFSKDVDPEVGFGYIVPRWLPSLPAFAQHHSAWTIFRLPLTQADPSRTHCPAWLHEKIDGVKASLLEVPMSTLLFLRKLRRICVEIEDGSGSGRVVERREVVCEEKARVWYSSRTLTANLTRDGPSPATHTTTETFITHRRTFPVPKPPVPSSQRLSAISLRRLELQQTSVTVALPIPTTITTVAAAEAADRESESDTGQWSASGNGCSVFADLPTRVDSKMPFVVNAKDFTTTASRESLDFDDELRFNRFLLDRVADTFLDFVKRAAPTLTETPAMIDWILSWLPIPQTVHPSFRPCASTILTHMRAVPLLPSHTGSLCTPPSLSLPPVAGTGSPPPQPLYACIRHIPLVHPHYAKRTAVLAALGVKKASVEALFQPSGWAGGAGGGGGAASSLVGLSDDQVGEVYEYVREVVGARGGQVLRKVPFLKTDEGFMKPPLPVNAHTGEKEVRVCLPNPQLREAFERSQLNDPSVAPLIRKRVSCVFLSAETERHLSVRTREWLIQTLGVERLTVDNYLSWLVDGCAEMALSLQSAKDADNQRVLLVITHFLTSVAEHSLPANLHKLPVLAAFTRVETRSHGEEAIILTPREWGPHPSAAHRRASPEVAAWTGTDSAGTARRVDPALDGLSRTPICRPLTAPLELTFPSPSDRSHFATLDGRYDDAAVELLCRTHAAIRCCPPLSSSGMLSWMAVGGARRGGGGGTLGMDVEGEHSQHHGGDGGSGEVELWVERASCFLQVVLHHDYYAGRRMDSTPPSHHHSRSRSSCFYPPPPPPQGSLQLPQPLIDAARNTEWLPAAIDGTYRLHKPTMVYSCASEIPASLHCLFPLLHPALVAPLVSLVPASPFSPSPPTHIITQILSVFGVHHALSLTPMLERLRVMAADTPPTSLTERRMRQLVDLYGAMGRLMDSPASPLHQREGTVRAMRSEKLLFLPLRAVRDDASNTAMAVEGHPHRRNAQWVSVDRERFVWRDGWMGLFVGEVLTLCDLIEPAFQDTVKPLLRHLVSEEPEACHYAHLWRKGCPNLVQGNSHGGSADQGLSTSVEAFIVQAVTVLDLALRRQEDTHWYPSFAQNALVWDSARRTFVDRRHAFIQDQGGMRLPLSMGISIAYAPNERVQHFLQHHLGVRRLEKCVRISEYIVGAPMHRPPSEPHQRLLHTSVIQALIAVCRSKRPTEMARLARDEPTHPIFMLDRITEVPVNQLQVQYTVANHGMPPVTLGAALTHPSVQPSRRSRYVPIAAGGESVPVLYVNQQAEHVQQRMDVGEAISAYLGGALRSIAIDWLRSSIGLDAADLSFLLRSEGISLSQADVHLAPRPLPPTPAAPAPSAAAAADRMAIEVDLYPPPSSTPSQPPIHTTPTHLRAGDRRHDRVPAHQQQYHPRRPTPVPICEVREMEIDAETDRFLQQMESSLVDDRARIRGASGLEAAAGSSSVTAIRQLERVEENELERRGRAGEELAFRKVFPKFFTQQSDYQTHSQIDQRSYRVSFQPGAAWRLVWVNAVEELGLPFDFILFEEPPADSEHCRLSINGCVDGYLTAVGETKPWLARGGGEGMPPLPWGAPVKFIEAKCTVFDSWKFLLSGAEFFFSQLDARHQTDNFWLLLIKRMLSPSGQSCQLPSSRTHAQWRFANKIFHTLHQQQETIIIRWLRCELKDDGDDGGDGQSSQEGRGSVPQL
ncbi:unnamed protein product [Vitrella brassicaformis CCMP3155]|uniref:Sacsin/Nov domain-containing protein n=1 Tax=Vitrella brassicaformis (strain CCMP3155) TaxID=1169540 RepID=A0A0G4GII4_VITBC|nr:unnamed protein product [Vitrella brassicaformis CCMP3155]|eukprot:CEM29646.1 unnamed protein product [Vitrella brassicaformis CCMP3155]